jgi:hypothetical protein
MTPGNTGVEPTPVRRVVESRIVMLRGQRVMLAADLAELYGEPVRRLNEQVRRNLARFPDDFMFQLTKEENRILKSQIATSSWGGVGCPNLVSEGAEVGAASPELPLSEFTIRHSQLLRRKFKMLDEMEAGNRGASPIFPDISQLQQYAPQRATTPS